MNNPSPIRGDIPIMIGGSGEKKTLRMVAQYADASNFFGDADAMRHLIGVLEDHCERLGRDPSEITTTRLGTIVIADRPTRKPSARSSTCASAGCPNECWPRSSRAMPDAVAEKATELLDAGLDGLIFNSPDAHDLETIALLGETLGPLVADRGVAGGLSRGGHRSRAGTSTRSASPG